MTPSPGVRPQGRDELENGNRSEEEPREEIPAEPDGVAAEKRRVLRWALVGVAVLALAGAAGWRFLSPREEAPAFQTEKALRRTLTEAVTASGQVNPVVKVQVGSQVSGIIQKLYADYNSVVRKGQVIAEIDPRTYEASVRQNEAELASAIAALDLARADERRSQELFAGALVARSDHETVVSKLRQAEAAVQVRQALLERSRADLAFCTIYAPIDGVVISRSVDVGQTVAANFSAPTLFQIANDLTRMQVDAKVSEADIGGIRAGQAVRFTVDAFPSRTFAGRVTQVRNEAVTSQNVVTYDTVIEAQNPDLLLKPGMTATVSIVLAEAENALVVPNAALSYRPSESAMRAAGPPQGPPPGAMPAGPPPDLQGGQLVFVVKGGPGEAAASRIAPVRVRAGITDGTATQVLEGIEEGDEVVTGETAATKSSASGRRTSNPFSGSRPGAGGPPPPPPGGGGP